MKRITVELSDEVAAGLEQIAGEDRRSVDDWLDYRLRRDFWGAVALMPERFRNMQIVRGQRGYITSRVRAKVYKLAGGKCTYCACALDPFDGWEVDHMLPVSRGGTSARENLCAACDACNAAKRALTAEEFRAKRAAA